MHDKDLTEKVHKIKTDKIREEEFGCVDQVCDMCMITEKMLKRRQNILYCTHRSGENGWYNRLGSNVESVEGLWSESKVI